MARVTCRQVAVIVDVGEPVWTESGAICYCVVDWRLTKLIESSTSDD